MKENMIVIRKALNTDIIEHEIFISEYRIGGEQVRLFAS